MNILKRFLGILYKMFVLIRERFFLIPAQKVPTPSLFMVEGMGGLESSQIFSESVTPATRVDVKDEDGIEEKESFGKEMEDRKIPPLFENQRISLCETLDRVLNTGVVVHGDITISVANIDLIYISLRTLITSVETARQLQEKP